MRRQAPISTRPVRRRHRRHGAPGTCGRSVCTRDHTCTDLHTPRRRGYGRSRPVSRILSPLPVARRRVATIYLGRRSPDASSGLPGTRWRATCWSLLGLAPGGACLAATVTRRAGELLPHRFTLTCGTASRRRSALCCAFRVSPRLGVTQHPALWSPDFPRPGVPEHIPDAAAWPAPPVRTSVRHHAPAWHRTAYLLTHRSPPLPHRGVERPAPAADRLETSGRPAGPEASAQPAGPDASAQPARPDASAPPRSR